ncbi:DoxX family protein [Bordetella sp. FB-8]|uniref:DoxX family protein n=1 Tax=Bordetella sp. FB-8 TaxID=1159870 RepID=UPI000475BB79|nr:DoxX family protein [Bordetella sp. FB-8]
MSKSESSGPTERAVIVVLRVMVGWIFLWAAIHHYGNSAYVGAFLSATKTFHPIYGALARSPLLPVISFLVEYGHLLIGLSLITGFLVRASGPFAILIMLLYWTAHMNFPYIDNANYVIVDEHLIIAAVIVWLMVRHAGQVCGLDGLVARMAPVRRSAGMRWLVGLSPQGRAV